jgi:hypothetical protein
MHLQGVHEDITMCLQCFFHKVLTRLLQSWFIMFYKDFRFVFARCFTRLLYGFYVLFMRFLQGFEKVITRLLQGFYTAFTRRLQSF